MPVAPSEVLPNRGLRRRADRRARSSRPYEGRALLLFLSDSSAVLFRGLAWQELFSLRVLWCPPWLIQQPVTLCPISHSCARVLFGRTAAPYRPNAGLTSPLAAGCFLYRGPGTCTLPEPPAGQ